MKIFLISLFAMAICKNSLGQTTWFDTIVTHINQMPAPQEGQNGRKPAAHAPVGQWSPFVKQDMDGIWQSIGLKGVNYYCVGEPASGKDYIQRNDFNSKYYQGWFGIYIIDAKKSLFNYSNDSLNSPSVQNIKNLLSVAVLDQTAWLIAMGDASKSSTSLATDNGTIPVVATNTIDGQQVPMIEFEMKSHSDLTDSDSRLSGIFRMPGKDYWKDQLSTNHDITIKGFYMYWYSKTSQTLNIIYGSGCAFKTNNAKAFDTYPLIREEMLTMARQAHFIAAD